METQKSTPKTPDLAKLEVELITLENNIRNLKAVANALAYYTSDLATSDNNRIFELFNQELERQIEFITGVIFPDIKNER